MKNLDVTDQAKDEEDLKSLLRDQSRQGQKRLDSRIKKSVGNMRRAADRYRLHVKPHIPGNPELDPRFQPEVVRDGVASTRTQLRDLRRALDQATSAAAALGPQAIRLLRGGQLANADPGPKGKIERSLRTPELQALSRCLDEAIERGTATRNKKKDTAIVHLACVVGRQLRDLGIPLALSETGGFVTGSRGGGTWARAIELCLKMVGLGEGRKLSKHTLRQARAWMDPTKGGL